MNLVSVTVELIADPTVLNSGRGDLLSLLGHMVIKDRKKAGKLRGGVSFVCTSGKRHIIDSIGKEAGKGDVLHIVGGFASRKRTADGPVHITIAEATILADCSADQFLHPEDDGDDDE